MSERIAYLIFVTIVGGAVAVMTAGLAVIWFFLVRQNRRSRRGDTGPGPGSRRSPGL